MANNPIDITKELKKAERKAKWQRRFQSATNWVRDNRGLLIATVPVVAGTIGTGIKVLGRRHNLHVETRNKDRRVYDTRLGHYWELRRKLSNKEWVKIDQRMAKGERMSDILFELGVLR